MPPLQQDITPYGAVGDEQSFGLQQNPVFPGSDLSLEAGISTMPAILPPLYLNPNGSFHVVKGNADWYTTAGVGLDLGVGGRGIMGGGGAVGLHMALEEGLTHPSEHDVKRLGMFFHFLFPQDNGTEILLFARGGAKYLEDGTHPLFISLHVGVGRWFYK